jgi:hypothetical protein
MTGGLSSSAQLHRVNGRESSVMVMCPFEVTSCPVETKLRISLLNFIRRHVLKT